MVTELMAGPRRRGWFVEVRHESICAARIIRSSVAVLVPRICRGNRKRLLLIGGSIVGVIVVLVLLGIAAAALDPRSRADRRDRVDSDVHEHVRRQSQWPRTDHLHRR